MTSIATEISDLELWTKACIVDELTVHLASVTFDVTHHDHVTNNIKTLRIHKYQYQASELLKYIGVVKSPTKVHSQDIRPIT